MLLSTALSSNGFFILESTEEGRTFIRWSDVPTGAPGRIS
jgi:hypothetical protein